MTDGQFPGGPPDPSLATQSLVPEVITCAVLTTLVAGAAVAARFYARWRILDVVGTEDWLIFVAFVCCDRRQTVGLAASGTRDERNAS